MIPAGGGFNDMIVKRPTPARKGGKK